jgi:hypothetical protein
MLLRAQLDFTYIGKLPYVIVDAAVELSPLGALGPAVRQDILM